MKRALCMILSMAMLLGMFQIMPVFADEKQDYNLTPTNMIEGSVATNSKYILKTPVETDTDTIAANFSIDDQDSPSISKMDGNEFMIYPKTDFEANRLYTFRLKVAGSEDITWVYQTAARFDVTQVFPDDTATKVPVNTGIEITFNYENYEDITPYFSISPQVSGKFEKHDKTTVFVPDKLEQETLYTVTLKKGVKLNGTDSFLQEDRVFSFETEGQEENNNTTSTLNGQYDQDFQSFATTDIPNLTLRLYKYNENGGQQSNHYQMSTSVYQYSSPDQFINEFSNLDHSYYWAIYNRADKKINADGLQKIMTFETEQDVEADNYEGFPVKLPQALPQGQYLIDTVVENTHFQAFVQSTDISSYLQPSSNQNLIWLNNIQTQTSIGNATIKEIKTGQTYQTNADGIAEIPNQNEPKEEDQNKKYSVQTELQYFLVTTQDSLSSIVLSDYYPEKQEKYWQFLELDRPLYKPEDTVQFWGYVKNRAEEEKIDQLTVELSQGGYYGYWWGPRQTMVKQTVSVTGNAYNGEIKLPYLKTGSYVVQVKKGDQVISSTYISIEDYVKPSYKMEIAPDKKAVFEGDTVKYKIKTAFFDGTPLPNLEVNYNINSSTSTSGKEDKVTTDSKGEAEISYQVPVSDQSTTYGGLYMYARATLPETGEISCESNISLYANDIMVTTKDDFKGTQPIIQAKVNQIDLSRINNGIEDENESVEGAPVGGKRLEGTIIKNYYEKIEDGQTYDYINKVTVPKYRYEQKEEPVQIFQMVTKGDGTAEYPYLLPELKDGYYTAKLICKDAKGKEIDSDIYLRTRAIDYSKFYYNYGWDLYQLERQSEDKPVPVGEQVNFLFKHNADMLDKGKFLFIKAQNGIDDYSVQDHADYNLSFSEKDIPCVSLKGVYFNGYSYCETDNQVVTFDYNSRKMELDLSTDKEKYQPGENCTLSVKAKDPSGAPKQAAVNISIVDEALFALRDQNTDVLASLYAPLYPGVYGGYSSHGSYNDIYPKASASGGMGGGGGAEGLIQNKQMLYAADSAAPTANIREDFKDTAVFATIELNELGEGTYTFKLPDNITSWRITCSGVTKDLYAATNTANIKTSLPFFINYALADTFLEGDEPTIGLTAYGDSLKNDDAVNFEVTSEKDKAKKATVQGKAFQRINLPLWKMTEGEDNLIIKASTKNGISDALKYSIKTVKTYHEMTQTVYSTLTSGATLDHGTSGLTRYTFVDKSRGALLTDVLQFSNLCGNRIDQKLAKKLAYDLIQQYGDDGLKGIIDNEPEFKASDYQKESGGLSLFPYSGDDIDTTVKLLPFIKDEVDKTSMLNYLYTMLGNPNSNNFVPNAKVLYGLAAYGEPVLVQLDSMAKVENSSLIDQIYVALSYLELGEKYKAQQIYDEKIFPKMENMNPYYRVNTGKDQTDILEATSICAVLAAKLNAYEAQGLYEYTISNYTDEMLLNMEKIQYVMNQIDHFSDQTSKITYTLFGEEKSKELKNGECFTISLPSQNTKQLQITDVQGDVGVIAFYKAPLQGIEQSSDIEVYRKYSLYSSDNATTQFKQDDLVKVTITVKFNKKAMDGSYEVSDFLPSGLSFVDSTQEVRPLYGAEDQTNLVYAQKDGQKISFYSSTYEDGAKTYSYYARVVSPGKFKADGTIVQSTKADGVMTILDDQNIIIK